MRGVWVLLGLAVLVAAASVVPAAFGLALLGAAVFAALLALDIALGPSRDDLRVTRAGADFVALRRPGRLLYRVENRSAIGIRIGILESPVETFAFECESVEANVASRTFVELELGFEARERGLVRLSTTYLWVENRIGLLRRRFAADASEEVRVFPDFSAIERYGTLARRSTLLDAGLRKLRLRGIGAEFESLREYFPGDAFRSINWKATAHRGRIMVEQHEIERSQQVLVLLDAGRLMMPRIGPQRKFDYALTAGLSVAHIAQTAGDNVGLIAFAAKPVLSIAPRRGAAHVNALARAAYDLQPRLEEPDYETTFTDLKRRYGKRSLVVMFTDIFDPAASAAVLGGLATLVPRHLVMCVLMNDAAIVESLAAPVRAPAEAYRTSVAMMLSDERQKAIAKLRSLGIIIIDVPAPQLTVALLDAYLDVKARGLI
jgi:uncharacterized protein (DUF58 family)